MDPTEVNGKHTLSTQHSADHDSGTVIAAAHSRLGGVRAFASSKAVVLLPSVAPFLALPYGLASVSETWLKAVMVGGALTMPCVCVAAFFGLFVIDQRQGRRRDSEARTDNRLAASEAAVMGGFRAAAAQQDSRDQHTINELIAANRDLAERMGNVANQLTTALETMVSESTAAMNSTVQSVALMQQSLSAALQPGYDAAPIEGGNERAPARSGGGANQ